MKNIAHPIIIQGGMGIAISDWKLAKSVSILGHLGVVSGTAINSVLIRRLQDGDLDGSTRRALAVFPFPEVTEKILENYFISGGKDKNFPYKRSPVFSVKPAKALSQLNVAASFVEVFLAKENHSGVVGINLLEKIQMPNMSCLYGALLAGVDYVLMGAGIPKEIPGILDKLAVNESATMKVSLDNSNDSAVMTFDPKEIFENQKLPELRRPFFFPIVSSATLALNLKKKSTGQVDGFIVEGPLAGGHNAPPRGPMQLSDLGEPIYGVRDTVNLADMKALELPFWMAGSSATPERLAQYQSEGAHGIQVGTLFAFCEESGLASEYKNKVINKIISQEEPINGWVFTDPVSSPTGFPFKAVRMQGSLSDSELYQKRRRICDLGYLRSAYQKEDGTVGYRCAAEPIDDFVKKGGTVEQTIGKKCLCNALMADIGMAQRQTWKDAEPTLELPMLTAGDDLNLLNRILKGKKSFTAKDVIQYLIG